MHVEASGYGEGGSHERTKSGGEWSFPPSLSCAIVWQGFSIYALAWELLSHAAVAKNASKRQQNGERRREKLAPCYL